MLFDSTHIWVIVDPMTYDNENATTKFIDEMFQNLNLSVDADIAVVASCGMEKVIFIKLWSWYFLIIFLYIVLRDVLPSLIRRRPL